MSLPLSNELNKTVPAKCSFHFGVLVTYAYQIWSLFNRKSNNISIIFHILHSYTNASIYFMFLRPHLKYTWTTFHLNYRPISLQIMIVYQSSSSLPWVMIIFPFKALIRSLDVRMKIYVRRTGNGGKARESLRNLDRLTRCLANDIKER